MEFLIEGRRITVNVPNWAALEARVSERFAQKKGFALATLNLDHLSKLRRSERFRAAYAAQDLVTADGNPIVWMARLAGRPLELIPGSDAVLPLARVAARHGVGVALVGSSGPVLAACKSHLEREVRNLEVVCTIAPPMGFDPDGPEADSLLREIAASGARLCFVAMSAPKQEQLSARGRQLAPAVGFAGIGAGLDFIARTQRRAPVWARSLAMEWLWRALTSPRRLGPRYLKCFAILPSEMLRAIRIRLRIRRA